MGQYIRKVSRKTQIRENCFNILTEFGIPMKLVRLTKMCLNETYSNVCTGKHLSDAFHNQNHIKQGDAKLSLLFLYLALDCVFRKVKEK
jgi:hypothetical protein